MSTMQAFYHSVISSNKPSNPYVDSLLRLTRVSIDEVAMFKTTLTWSLWS